jgi:simple sugar transport system ATP-binding protein
VIASLALRNISKRFGATVALSDVSFDVAPGQVHALLGENGAGKSTLMRIGYGLLRPDAGTITIAPPRSPSVTTSFLASPRAARDAGIGMVHQHFTSIPALTVAENIALAADWRETGRRAAERAGAVVQRLGLPLDPTAYVETLSVQLRQRLEIVKALASDARILLLDEPTAVLAPPEVAELLTFMRNFATGGGAVVLITHKLDEVMQVADRVTVLRRGVVTLDREIAHETPHSLSRAMIGGELVRVPQQPPTTGDNAIVADQLTLRQKAHGASSGVAVRNVTVAIRAGEIVGIAAIDGNGQRELLRAIAGVDQPAILSGTLRVAGPVAFIPEDRTTEAIIGAFTLTENLLLASSDRAGWWLDWDAIRARTAALLQQHDVRAPGPDIVIDTLSGGNQQKFIFGRALDAAPKVIVAEDPTRGLDVRATQAIHDGLRAAARAGVAVIVHCSDLDEVLELADRLLVMTRGRLHELPRDSSRDTVGDAMLALQEIA